GRQTEGESDRHAGGEEQQQGADQQYTCKGRSHGVSPRPWRLCMLWVFSWAAASCCSEIASSGRIIFISSTTYCRHSKAKPTSMGVAGIHSGMAAMVGVVQPPSQAS